MRLEEYLHKSGVLNWTTHWRWVHQFVLLRACPGAHQSAPTRAFLFLPAYVYNIRTRSLSAVSFLLFRGCHNARVSAQTDRITFISYLLKIIEVGPGTANSTININKQIAWRATIGSTASGGRGPQTAELPTRKSCRAHIMNHESFECSHEYHATFSCNDFSKG